MRLLLGLVHGGRRQPHLRVPTSRFNLDHLGQRALLIISLNLRFEDVNTRMRNGEPGPVSSKRRRLEDPANSFLSSTPIDRDDVLRRKSATPTPDAHRDQDPKLLYYLDGYSIIRRSHIPFASGGFCDIFIGDHEVHGKVAMRRPRMTEKGYTMNEMKVSCPISASVVPSSQLVLSTIRLSSTNPNSGRSSAIQTSFNFWVSFKPMGLSGPLVTSQRMAHCQHTLNITLKPIDLHWYGILSSR